MIENDNERLRQRPSVMNKAGFAAQDKHKTIGFLCDAEGCQEGVQFISKDGWNLCAGHFYNGYWFSLGAGREACPGKGVAGCSRLSTGRVIWRRCSELLKMRKRPTRDRIDNARFLLPEQPQDL